jgi:O-antigen/teichoic acid export membrane protein
MFAVLAVGTSLFLLAVPADQWLPIGVRIPRVVFQVGVALEIGAVLGVLLGKRWGYIAALVATLATAAVASWTFFGYPKHSPQGAFIAAWIFCLAFQILAGVRDQSFSETK